MLAYYNEHDPEKAAALEALMRDGWIAPGHVDQRDIRDVTPDELSGYAQCHFFAGIGLWSVAARRAGIPDSFPLWSGSCPCQPFSAAGAGDGIADDRHLWPYWYWLVAQCHPDAVVGEQVASKDGLAWFDLVSADMEGSDYAGGALDLCSAGFGSPNIRQRFFMCWLADREGERHERSGAARHRGHGLADQRDDGGLADSGSTTRERHGGAVPAAQTQRAGARGSDGRRDLGYSDGGAVGGMGDRIGAGLERRTGDGDRGGEPGRERADPARSAAEAGYADRLDDAASPRHQPARRRQPDQSGSGERLSGLGCEGNDADGMAYPDSNRFDQRRAGISATGDDGPFGNDERGSRALRDPLRGPANGFWSGAEWLLCRDPNGPKLRPVRPGSFCLAPGYPGRNGELRAYGDAINLQVATAWLEEVSPEMIGHLGLEVPA